MKKKKTTAEENFYYLLLVINSMATAQLWLLWISLQKRKSFLIIV